MERRRDTDVGTSKGRTAAHICNGGGRREDEIRTDSGLRRGKKRQAMTPGNAAQRQVIRPSAADFSPEL
jgi:hypothetical protein